MYSQAEEDGEDVLSKHGLNIQHIPVYFLVSQRNDASIQIRYADRPKRTASSTPPPSPLPPPNLGVRSDTLHTARTNAYALFRRLVRHLPPEVGLDQTYRGENGHGAKLDVVQRDGKAATVAALTHLK